LRSAFDDRNQNTAVAIKAKFEEFMSGLGGADQSGPVVTTFEYKPERGSNTAALPRLRRTSASVCRRNRS